MTYAATIVQIIKKKKARPNGDPSISSSIVSTMLERTKAFNMDIQVFCCPKCRSVGDLNDFKIQVVRTYAKSIGSKCSNVESTE